MRIRSLSTSFEALALIALGALTGAAGCASEEYYCDASGCFTCDGVGCRAATPPTRANCRGDFECAANQVWYSLSRRGVEFDLLPWQQARHMPLMAYSPIDQGALAGHAGLKRLAQRLGATPAQLALARLLAEPGVMVIPKSSDPSRLRENFDAAALRLDASACAQIDAMFPPPRRRVPLAVG